MAISLGTYMTNVWKYNVPPIPPRHSLVIMGIQNNVVPISEANLGTLTEQRPNIIMVCRKVLFNPRTMGPQPELARHGWFLTVICIFVKCKIR